MNTPQYQFNLENNGPAAGGEVVGSKMVRLYEISEAVRSLADTILFGDYSVRDEPTAAPVPAPAPFKHAEQVQEAPVSTAAVKRTVPFTPAMQTRPAAQAGSEAITVDKARNMVIAAYAPNGERHQ